MTDAEAAPAKLNLFLNVAGRRDDGYHLLDSLFVFVGLADELSLTPGGALSLDVEGLSADAIAGDDNLVLRAARKIAEAAGAAPSFRLRLRKRIPVAAGLGGGSADAAAALRLIARRWRLDWPQERLLEIAASLGADVPACLAGRAVIARGTGGDLSPAPILPDCGILLANPNIATPTPEVFAAYRTMNPVVPDWASRGLPALGDRHDDLAALVAAISPRGNDLLPAALRVTPEIGGVLAVLQRLPGAAYAGLSGSGATCFALFHSAEAAAAAQTRLHTAPGRSWWSWAGAMTRPGSVAGQAESLRR